MRQSSGPASPPFDGSIVNVALPAIERDLGGGLSAQQWVSNAYLLALASLILVGGSLLELELFSHRNFAVGNAETLAMYGGLGILFFFLTIFLQEVAGYTALESGLAVLPVTLVMFALSRRFGAVADRFGLRWFMGSGPRRHVRGQPRVGAGVFTRQS